MGNLSSEEIDNDEILLQPLRRRNLLRAPRIVNIVFNALNLLLTAKNCNKN